MQLYVNIIRKSKIYLNLLIFQYFLIVFLCPVSSTKHLAERSDIFFLGVSCMPKEISYISQDPNTSNLNKDCYGEYVLD